MKRFYKLVSINKESNGWSIHLDGRPVKTPLKTLLLAPTEAMATLIQQEWSAQEKSIIPESMPITQILCTQFDSVRTQRPAMTAPLLKYLNTDLLCYHAGDEPPGQAEKQHESWTPWLTWFENHFGTALKTTDGLTALEQPEPAHTAIKKYVEALNEEKFTIFQLITPLSGSIVLAAAFIEGAITPNEIFTATHVEEHFKDKIYNAELHGIDPLQEKKDAAMMRDLEAATQFLNTLKN